MHDFIMGIGNAVVGLFKNISGESLINALEVMGIGYLGIFIVTGIIILAVYALSWFTREK